MLALTACGLSGPSEPEFPDAGPGGPDSLLAGVGRSIPFGLFGIPRDAYGAPYTGAVTGAERSNIGRILWASQRGKTRVVLNLAGPRRYYISPDGTFSLALWKQRIDAFRDVDFGPYVTEGLILAHFLVDEPNDETEWGGRDISYDDLEEMAKYSKSIWPSLPTAVRAPPGWLKGSRFSWQYVDIAWAQWAGPHSASRGRTPEQFRDENVAEAKQLGMGLVFGMNLLDGGDGSSGIAGTLSDRWQMSPEEVVRVGTVFASTPYACALLSWRYEPAFQERAEVRAALDSVASAARERGGISCLQRGPAQ
jgi:hypothetical protein